MINERLKEIRETLKLSQSEFAKKLNLQRNSISLVENGKRNLSDRTIQDICNKFNVNEEWLRDGIGEMFCQDEKSIVNELVVKYNLDDIVKSCLDVLVTLEPEEIKPLLDYIKKVALKYASEHIEEVQQVYEEQQEQEVQQEQEEQQVQEVQSQIDEDIQRELEAYRLELEAEKKGKTSSVYEDYAKKNA